RAFSAGQRALLWAAGVLGLLAIVSAVLLVLADQQNRNTPPPQVIETETVTPGVPEPAPLLPPDTGGIP
ncbi:MAG: serine/threonine protein kinase, partial [Mycobacteriaceae bacterium]|nr:serine/threonine protein kinase [Mycobacteriaceae bacterium]